jgi:23S rRNA pseudoU1915 N3-methylase RlmH
MTAIKEDSKSINVMDVIFNGWVSQLKAFEEMEQKSIQVIKSQKEWIEGTRDQFIQIEEDSKKLTSDWKANVVELLEKNQKEFGTQNVAELLNKLEDIGHKSQAIAFIPGKASFDILLNSRDQFEKSFLDALEQQKKSREDLTKAYEEVIEQLKQSQDVNSTVIEPSSYHPTIFASSPSFSIYN